MYLWLENISGTVQKWSFRPLLDSLKGGLNIGILLYWYRHVAFKASLVLFLNFRMAEWRKIKIVLFLASKSLGDEWNCKWYKAIYKLHKILLCQKKLLLYPDSISFSVQSCRGKFVRYIANNYLKKYSKRCNTVGTR